MRERSGRKFINHAAGRLRVADVMGQRADGRRCGEAHWGEQGAKRRSEPQRIFEPDAGAARAEAPPSERTVPDSGPMYNPRSAARRLYIGAHLMQRREAAQIGCAVWRVFLRRGPQRDLFTAKSAVVEKVYSIF